MENKVENKEPSDTRTGCLFIIAVLLADLVFGAMSIIEILSWFSIKLPMFINFTFGFFLGVFTIPVAVVGFIFKVLFGV